MYKRYHGNSGRVERVEERDRREPFPPPAPSFPRPGPPRPPGPPHVLPPGTGLPGQLGQLLPGMREPLEAEDILLLLILYLLYRESGDTELLMIMGAMFLL